MKAPANRYQYVVGLAAALLVAACASKRLAPGTDHPGNAQAETAPMRCCDHPHASMTPPQSTSENAPEAREHGTPTTETYTCPMHAQVVRSASGKCPICGMNLVKSAAAAPE